MLHRYLLPPPSRLLHSASYLAYLIIFDLIGLIIFGEGYKLRSSSLCSLLYPSVTTPFLGPNILLNTLFSNFLDLCFSFKNVAKFKCLGAAQKIIINAFGKKLKAG
jgi:hypothetical protein